MICEERLWAQNLVNVTCAEGPKFKGGLKTILNPHRKRSRGKRRSMSKPNQLLFGRHVVNTNTVLVFLVNGRNKE